MYVLCLCIGKLHMCISAWVLYACVSMFIPDSVTKTSGAKMYEGHWDVLPLS